MVYTRENDHYDLRLAGNLLKACENGTADFLNTTAVPYYTQDMITGQALRDIGQLQTLLNNRSQGAQYINYAPTYIFQDSKRDWAENINKDDREVGCVIYKGKDENGNKHYEMMSPAGKINPAGINESPMTQTPVPNIGICRNTPSLDPQDPKSIEKYISDVIGNYFNAAFTKTPYFAPQWGGLETEMLSKALNADPSLALRAAQQGYAQATSVKMENTVNHELNDNVREAIKQGLPPFNTAKQTEITGPVNANRVPANGVDFINAYYDGIKEKKEAVKGNTAQNGYVPYQTHNENPKNIDRYLVEEYGNIINASLTGKPYSGSISSAQLKTLVPGIEAKMTNNPAYMTGIVNQAQQNVLGSNYLPYDKENFIKKAQDTSSGEFKILDQMIANHVKDMCVRNKESFNGEFQELSKDLTAKIKNTLSSKTTAKPSTRTSTAKNPSAASSAAKETTSTSTRTAKNSSAASSAAKETASTSTRTAERPSFLKEVTDFVSKNIVEKKPALILVDTFLGSLVDRAKRIVLSGTVQTVSSAYNIASKANTVSKSVINDAQKQAVRETVKTGENVRQRQPVKTTARTPARR